MEKAGIYPKPPHVDGPRHLFSNKSSTLADNDRVSRRRQRANYRGHLLVRASFNHIRWIRADPEALQQVIQPIVMPFGNHFDDFLCDSVLRRHLRNQFPVPCGPIPLAVVVQSLGQPVRKRNRTRARLSADGYEHLLRSLRHQSCGVMVPGMNRSPERPFGRFKLTCEKMIISKCPGYLVVIYPIIPFILGELNRQKSGY